MKFGEAIDAMKDGKCVARAGWNGKGMYVYLNRGSRAHDADQGAFYEGVPASLFEMGDSGTSMRLPNINMHTAHQSIVTGWLASQTDILAEDWSICD